MKQPHDLLLAVDAIKITEPGVTRAKLGAGLLEDKDSAGRGDAEDCVGHPATECFHVAFFAADEPTGSQICQSIVGS